MLTRFYLFVSMLEKNFAFVEQFVCFDICVCDIHFINSRILSPLWILTPSQTRSSSMKWMLVSDSPEWIGIIVRSLWTVHPRLTVHLSLQPYQILSDLEDTTLWWPSQRSSLDYAGPLLRVTWRFISFVGDSGIYFSLRAGLSANSLDLPDALHVIRSYSKIGSCQLGEELIMSFVSLNRSYLLVARDFVKFWVIFWQRICFTLFIKWWVMILHFLHILFCSRRAKGIFPIIPCGEKLCFGRSVYSCFNPFWAEKRISNLGRTSKQIWTNLRAWLHLVAHLFAFKPVTFQLRNIDALRCGILWAGVVWIYFFRKETFLNLITQL